MIGHEQALDNFPLHHVTFHDFRHIGFGPHPIPDAFRVDDNAGAVLAVIQTAGLVRSYRTLQAQPLDLFLEKGLQPLGPLVGATASRVAFRALVHTDKEVMRKGRHSGSGADRGRCPSRHAIDEGVHGVGIDET